MKFKNIFFILTIGILILLVIYLANNRQNHNTYPIETSPHISDTIRKSLKPLPTLDNFRDNKNDNIAPTPSAPPSKNENNGKTWTPITGQEVSESSFIEDLNSDILTSVAENLQSLTEEIAKKQAENPDYVLRGEWVNFSHSKQYLSVLDLGIKAVKPLYYILCKSNEAGLYEYLISSAINDIIGLDISSSNSKKIGSANKFNLSNESQESWSDAVEFRNLYNETVKQSITNFNIILDGAGSEGDKMTQIYNIGTFAIPLLLNEVDAPKKRISTETIYEGIKYLVQTYTKEDVPKDIEIWKTQNENYYRNLLNIMK